MIHSGDLFDVLPTLAAESVDACVTDPPYELKFMGKGWDGSGVAFNVETWRAVYRVLKPGAYLVACGGTRTSHRMVCAIEDAGFEIRDSLAWLYGSGFPKNHDLGNGKGTALKPAHEPIALAWKPFPGTIKACHAVHGTAALNIEACQIDGKPRTTHKHGNHTGNSSANAIFPMPNIQTVEPVGRWPANVVLDDRAAASLDEQSGELPSGGSMGRDGDGMGIRGNVFTRQTVGMIQPSIGGASRFYYVAKPSRDERDLGERNSHPTVKPLALMRWLVRLVTPVNGTVLDPFLGSGTTAMAAVLEQRGWIGIEREPQYLDIARRRIHGIAPLFSPLEQPA